MKVICGIYKITSPSGKIYIGQSEHINRRWRLYMGKHIIGDSVSAESCPTILRRSFKKHGFDKHNFEIIEICEYEKLNEREMFWISFYDSFNTPHGMNCTKGGGGVKGLIWSEESKLKASLKHKGQIQWNAGIKATEEHIEKNRQAQVKRWQREKEKLDYYSEEKIEKRKIKKKKDWSVVRKEVWDKIKANRTYNSEEEKEKRSLRAKKREQKKKKIGYKVTEETKKRNSVATKKMWDRKKRDAIPFFSEKALENMRNAQGNRYSKEANEKNSVAHKKLILNTQTGIFYFGLKDAVASTHISYSTLSHKLCGSYKNNTSFIYT